MSTIIDTPKGPVTIRPAVTEDASALRRLRLEALRGHPDFFAADVAFTESESDESWAARIASYALENKALICVAEAGGVLVGMTGLGAGNWPKTRHSGVIWGVYVNPEWRSLHLAEALIEECFLWARQQDLTIVKLGVVTTNTPAIRCYTRIGFTVFGVEPQAICNDGVTYDELLMAKVLN